MRCTTLILVIAAAATAIQAGEVNYGEHPANGWLDAARYAEGVKLQSVGDPLPCVSNPHGLDEQIQGSTVCALSRLNQIEARQIGDPEIDTRTLWSIGRDNRLVG